MRDIKKTVVILGASPDRERFANKAIRLLAEAGHRLILVNPSYDEVEGLPCLPSLEDIAEPVDTLTLYLSGERLTPMIESILDIRPQRVIFNPGVTNIELKKKLEQSRIFFIEECTLVMLNAGRF